MSYSSNYLDQVYKGIKNASITDKNGTELGLDKGLEMWTEKAERVRMEYDGLIFFCGNGASATMAEHMSHDWFQNAKINTTTCSETAHITAISNDIGYDSVFSYRAERILSDKDLLVGISSSGNSVNILNAIEAAKKKGTFTIGLSGKNADNGMRSIVDLSFYVPLNTYSEVESAHALILHMALDSYLDRYRGGRH